MLIKTQQHVLKMQVRICPLFLPDFKQLPVTAFECPAPQKNPFCGSWLLTAFQA
jgi:hypothetical protein